MKITFADSKLEKLIGNDRKLMKRLGRERKEKIKLRLEELDSADTLEDIRNVPGNYHELTGNRKGQWACDLDQPYRLIFIPQKIPIPVNEHGQYIWTAIKGVEVIEIINYHKEK